MKDTFDRSDSIFDRRVKQMGKVWGGIVLIHVVVLLGILLFGKWQEVFHPTPTYAVLIWFIINDLAGIFAIAFAAVCFSGGGLLLKVIGYPLGLVILLAMFCTVSFPFLIIGVIIGACCPFSS